MRYQRLSTYCEAFQYTGDLQAAQAFCLDNRDFNRDSTNRPTAIMRVVPYDATAEGHVQIWVEKSSGYCRIDLGDYIIAESDGTGVYPCKQDVFERTHIEAEDGSASA